MTFWEAAHQDELLPQKKRKGDWDNADRGMDSGSGKRNGLCDCVTLDFVGDSIDSICTGRATLHAKEMVPTLSPGLLGRHFKSKTHLEKSKGKKLHQKRWVIARKMEIGKFTENSLGKFTVILP